jgi:acyl-CoA synthetase (AMP-forming)/AMP-acid ligase II
MALNVSPSLKTASLVYGPTTEPLWNITLGALIEEQAAKYGERMAVVFPRQNIRRTYSDLLVKSRLVSKALIEQGLEAGDCVGIFAGNCCEYVEIFLGAGAIGCPVVVLNAGYTPTELRDAVIYSGKCYRCHSNQWL